MKRGRPRASKNKGQGSGALKKTTVKTIAQMAEVSPATVSLVLHGKGNLPEKTRTRVRQAIERSGYVRPVAKRLPSSINAIGVIVYDIENSYSGELFKGLEGEFQDQNIVSMMLSSNNVVERQNFLLAHLDQWGCAGAILIPANGSGHETLSIIQNLRMPIVLGVRHLGFGTFDYVGPNYFQGMSLATQHLIDLGHKRIAFVGGEANNSAYSERLGGFRMTIARAGDVESLEIQGPTTSSQFGIDAMADILRMKNPPTAIIAYNDQLAFGLMHAATEAGIVPGKDIAIVGFDDIRVSELQSIPLTTVSTPPSRIGLEMARLLKSRIDGNDGEPVNIIPPPVLKVRSSCGAPNDAFGHVRSAKGQSTRPHLENR